MNLEAKRIKLDQTTLYLVFLLLVLFVSTVDAFAPNRPRRTTTTTIPIVLHQSSFTKTDDDTTTTSDVETTSLVVETQQIAKVTPWAWLEEKIGTIDEDRIVYKDYDSGDVPRLFSSLTTTDTSLIHASASTFGAAALVAGTTIGAGVLALPTATAAAGFVPSTFALVSAWVYMTASGLLIAELCLNRLVGTGRPGEGLLEVYRQELPPPLAVVGQAAYFFLHYAVMVAYVAQGGNLLGDNVVVPGSIVFAGAVAATLLGTSAATMERVNNVLVAAVFGAFAALIGLGVPTTDWTALVDPANQHPEQVVNCLPILFLALVYQNIVPTVVTQLEGDRGKITRAIMAGTTLPMLLFVAWNAVVLGNGNDLTNNVGPLVTVFSGLAITTSMVGFTYGLLDAWTDVLQVREQDHRLPLYALVFVPPTALSLANPDIFYQALEYGGAFGVSTLFLVLPPLLVWQQRYASDAPLATKPLLPFGKIPLGSMWKVAATLMLEQTADKLGVWEFLRESIPI